MYMLEGGPRSGQLVDDLPSGYSIAPDTDPAATYEVFGDFVATTARWADAGSSTSSTEARID
jgi:hypothetical protein